MAVNAEWHRVLHTQNNSMHDLVCGLRLQLFAPKMALGKSIEPVKYIRTRTISQPRAVDVICGTEHGKIRPRKFQQCCHGACLTTVRQVWTVQDWSGTHSLQDCALYRVAPLRNPVDSHSVHRTRSSIAMGTSALDRCMYT